MDDIEEKRASLELGDVKDDMESFLEDYFKENPQKSLKEGFAKEFVEEFWENSQEMQEFLDEHKDLSEIREQIQNLLETQEKKELQRKMSKLSGGLSRRSSSSEIGLGEERVAWRLSSGGKEGDKGRQ